MKNRSAFSLIEISIVILIVGILIAGVIKGSKLIFKSRLSNAQTLTTSTSVASIPNLTLWLETSIDGSVTGATNTFPDDNEAVSSWNDRNPQTSAALKINPSQSTSSYRPLYVLNGIGGLPSLSFDGTNDYLRTASGGVTPIGQGDDTYTMVVVWQYGATATSAARYLISEGDTSGTVDKVASIFINSSDSSGFSGSENNYNPITITKGLPYVTIARINNNNATNVSLFYNTNTALSSFSSSNGPSALDLDASFFEIGAYRDGAFNPFQGLISEIIIFDRNLKGSEIAEINDYLSNKYSIRIN